MMEPDPAVVAAEDGGAWHAVTYGKLFDLLTALPLVSFWTYVVWRQILALAAYLEHTQQHHPPELVIATVASRSAMILVYVVFALFLILRLRPVGKAPGLLPRMTALVGTFLLLLMALFPRSDASFALSVLSAVLITGGSILAVVVIFRLGRSISIMAEARRLVTSGPYAVIRHPLYVAEEIAIIGIFLQYVSLPAALLLIVHFAVQFQRMRYEERVLISVFPEYKVYSQRTARLIPGIY